MAILSSSLFKRTIRSPNESNLSASDLSFCEYSSGLLSMLPIRAIISFPQFV